MPCATNVQHARSTRGTRLHAVHGGNGELVVRAESELVKIVLMRGISLVAAVALEDKDYHSGIWRPPGQRAAAPSLAGLPGAVRTHPVPDWPRVDVPVRL